VQEERGGWAFHNNLRQAYKALSKHEMAGKQ
jgi:hypothetical protein